MHLDKLDLRGEAGGLTACLPCTMLEGDPGLEAPTLDGIRVALSNE